MGALGRMPWGIQGLFQDALSKVFSFQKEARSWSGWSRRLAPQSTQPKKPQRGGPVAQDQTSTQRNKPQGGRRARRPGPVVHPTEEPRRARRQDQQRFDGLQRSQSLQSQRLETNQGASRSSQSSQNAERPKSRVFRRLQAQRGMLRQKVVFSTHTVARPKGVLSLTEAHRAVRKVKKHEW